MKVCSCCKESKPVDQFYKQKDRKNGTSYCKGCKNTYDALRWIKRKQDAIEYKGGSCSSCGYDKYYGALEFHHLDPQSKEFDWGKMRLRAWTTVTKELDKCILLCANCHREAHANNGAY